MNQDKISCSYLIFLIMLSFFSSCSTSRQKQEADVIIYGATSAGVVAAIEASRSGKSVILLEPGSLIGGLSTGGLGQTDIGNKHVIGGISREFYKGVKAYYSNEEHWKWENREDYRDGGQTRTDANEDAMWTFEPSAALEIMHKMLEDEEHILLVYHQALDRKNGLVVRDKAIRSIAMETGEVYSGKIFIDATYEGDLMAAAGVSYTYGRESVEAFDETYNGVQTLMATHHQLPDGVDPYIEEGNSASGLLPSIRLNSGVEGMSDKNIQAYCFRMCLTDELRNRIPFEKPGTYNELEYELLFRVYEKGYSGPSFIMSMMPNRKTDANNYGGFSSDFIGRNYAYPEGTYEERDSIVSEHKNYHLGLLWTLANHERIPEDVRAKWSQWGLPKDEYEAYDHWSPQLYIREARRMQSDFIMTQKHCTQEQENAVQSVGMGAYTMDSHNTQRYITSEGYVKNEGNIEVGGFEPYPIDYRSIVPKQDECSNLLVPVCLSSTHIAFGSIRMEPVFMILGQSAAAAAVLSIEMDCAVQEVPYEILKGELIRKNQILNLD